MNEKTLTYLGVAGIAWVLYRSSQNQPVIPVDISLSPAPTPTPAPAPIQLTVPGPSATPTPTPAPYVTLTPTPTPAPYVTLTPTPTPAPTPYASSLPSSPAIETAIATATALHAAALPTMSAIINTFSQYPERGYSTDHIVRALVSVGAPLATAQRVASDYYASRWFYALLTQGEYAPNPEIGNTAEGIPNNYLGVPYPQYYNIVQQALMPG